MEPAEEPGRETASARALLLLAAVQEAAAGLPRGAALGWERTGFRAAFLRPEPGQRIRAFLARPADRDAGRGGVGAEPARPEAPAAEP